MLLARELTEQVIGLAIEVHTNTGPGLGQVAISVIYKAMPIGEGFRADIVVAREVILEIKPIAAILPAHEAQLHTYLRMGGLRIGLILNFNARRLTE